MDYLTQDRKERLQQALKAVQEKDGSPDLIAALLRALEEYNKWHKFLKPVLSNMQAHIPPGGVVRSCVERGNPLGSQGRAGWIMGGRGEYYCSSTVICRRTIRFANNHWYDWDLAVLVTLIELVVLLPWYAETS